LYTPCMLRGAFYAFLMQFVYLSKKKNAHRRNIVSYPITLPKPHLLSIYNKKF
jgi:hypothetical protein